MNKDLVQHTQAIRQWLEKIYNMRLPETGLSSEEKKQLLAVNKSIEQLKKSGIPIPDELRSIKLTLSSKDVGYNSENIDIVFREVESILVELRDIVKVAVKCRDRLNFQSFPKGTKKHYGVSIFDLLKAGDLSTKDQLELQWLRNGPCYEGKLQSDGSIMAKTDNGWENFSSLSTAAGAISGKSQNGWQHWHLVTDDGNRIPLIKIRKRYMNKQG